MTTISNNFFKYTYNAGIAFALFNIHPLYPSFQNTSLTVLINEQTKRDYEEAGDYIKALTFAKKNYEVCLKSGLSEDAEKYSQDISRLEQKLLNFGSTHLLFDENFKPRFKLLNILALTEMPSSENTITKINVWAQKNLFHLNQSEKWQNTEKFEKLNSKIMPLLKELGFLEEVPSHFKIYEGAILHGGLLNTMRLRLNFLIQEWQKGVKFSKLYFLSSERPLDPSKENRDIFLDNTKTSLKVNAAFNVLEFPTTECELIQYIWEHSCIPEEFRHEIEVFFINAPMKTNFQGEKVIRPTTDDTVIQWLNLKPSPGAYLTISNAPYIIRQDLVIRTYSPKTYLFDTIGPRSSQENINIIIEELAKSIFQTEKLLK